MLDPQKLVTTSLIAFLIFLITIFFIRRREKFSFYFVLLASLLPLLSLLKRGVHQSGDFAINIAKAYDLWNSLSFGIFPVHWASILNATYGYPLFLFTYPLPYYAIAIPKFIGISFIASEKFSIALVFVLSGVGMYLLLKQFLNKNSSALGAILYLFAPYHLVDLHFRVALGELFAFAFLPLIFYSMLRISSRPIKRYVALLFFTYSCLVLSHQAITLIATPFIILFPLFILIRLKGLSGTFWKKEAWKVIPIYISLFCAFLATSFYWLPVVEGTAHTLQVEFSKHISFENPTLYFISPWRMGFLYQGPIGQLSFPMGFVQLALLVFLLISLFRGKIEKKLKKTSIILLTIFTFLLFLLFPFSEFVWKTIPFLTNFQFSYRMMLPVAFVLAIIGAISINKVRKPKIIYGIATIAMLSTILNWGTRAMLPDINDSYLMHHAPLATAEAEGLQPAAPISRDINNIWEKIPPESSLEVVNGQSTISVLSKTPTRHKYRLNVVQKSEFVENTYYFPGWNLYINGKNYPFSFIDAQKSNKIRFSLSPGTYDALLSFEATPIVTFANILSILGLILVVAYLAIPHRLR